MNSMLVAGIRKIRPAPLAAAIAQVSGLSRRRLIQTEHGTFSINPMSVLGSQLLRGEYEPKMRAVLASFLKPGGVFIDLGANEGYFTIVGSRLVGPTGTVISIEPQSRLQEVIQHNLAANACRNVRQIKAVVSAKSEKVLLNLTTDLNSGATSLFKRTKYRLPTEEVQSHTLVEMIGSLGLKGCDLMKVDIDGAEYDALVGAGEVLRRGVIRNLAIEVHESTLAQRGLSWQPVHETLLDSNYRWSGARDPWIYSFAA